jgi:ABC-2 type transport system permease protein
MRHKSGFLKGFSREVKNCLYDRNLFLIALIAPVLYLFFYGSVYLHNVSTRLDVAVVDYDRTQTSRLFSRWIQADKVIHVINLDNTETARLQVERGSIQGYIVFPQGLESNLKSRKQTVLGLYANTSSFLVSNELNKRFAEIIESINVGMVQKYWMTQGIGRKQAMSAALPVRIDISPLGNASYGYSSFVYIAIFLLILHQLGIMVISESLAKEKELGSIPGWKTANGNKLLTMLLSKTLPYFMLNLLYYLMLIVIAYPIFHLQVQCPIWQLILLAIPFYLAVNALGWVLGSLFQNQLQAFQLIVVSSMPLILISGYLWPVSAMPVMLRPLPYLLPTYPMMTMMQAMTQTAASIWQLLPFWLLMWLQAVVYGVLGYSLWNRVIRSK